MNTKKQAIYILMEAINKEKKMRIIKTISSVLTIWLLALCSNTVYAQQDSQYTQYMYNTVVINPAYAGNRGVLSLSSFYRTQWIGLEGAPKTISLSLNTPIGTAGVVGLGFSVVQDEIGPAKETFAAADFSYTINTSEKIKLSFGLKGGVTILNVDFSGLNFNPSDPNATNIINRISPTIGAGLYLHSEDKWYVGLSSPNFLKTNHYDDGNSVSNVTNEAHFYLMAGYVFNLNENLKFKPSALLKAVTGAPIALDLSANFLINQKFTLGGSYRLNAAVSGLVGIQISDSLMFGYAYDYDTTELGNYNSGSHEVFLRIELPTRSRAVVNPRFF